MSGNRKALARRLLAIGTAAGRRAEAGRTRFGSLAAAAAALTVALASIAAIGLAHQARMERIAGAVPVLDDSPAAGSRLLLVETAFDELEDGRQFTVVHLDPVGADAPLPPGMTAWPEPGQVLLSPRLHEEGADERIAERYGEYAGRIDPDALADLGQQIAYVVVDGDLAAVSEHPLHVVDFAAGGPASGMGLFWLVQDQDFSVPGLAAIAVAMLVLPALLLTAVAVRTGAELRDRREQLVTVLGGGRRERFLISLGESAVPVAAGALAAGAAVLTAAALGFTVPYADFAVADGELLRGWWLLVACLIAAAALVLLASALLGARTTDRRSTRPRPSRSPRLLFVWAALNPVFITVATLLPPLFKSTPLYPLLNLVGVAGVMVTLPAAAAFITAWFARRAERFGRRTRRPAWLVVGRRIAERPRSTARQVTGVAAGAILLCLILAFQGAFTTQAARAQQEVDRYGIPIVTVDARGQGTAAQTTAFIESLDGRVDLIAATEDYAGDSFTYRFSGGCEALEAFGLPCPAAGTVAELSGPVDDPRLARWLDRPRFGDLALTVEQDDPGAAVEGDDAMLLAAAADGGDVPVADVKAAGKAFTLGVSVMASNVSAGVPHREHARWIALFGTVGLMLLAAVAAIGAAGEFIRHSRALAPLVAVTGGIGVFRTMAALTVWLPLLAAALIGLGLGFVMTRPMMLGRIEMVTPELLVACGAAVSAIGLLMWWWAAAAMTKEASTWRPGRGDRPAQAPGRHAWAVVG